MPITPREYQQLPRGLRFAGWRPVVALVLTIVFAIIAQLVLIIPLVVYVMIAGLDLQRTFENMVGGHVDALTFAYLIAGLASLIPLSMLAYRIAYGIRPRYLSSVAGGFRWRWLARCLLITGPLFVIYIGLQLLLDWQPAPKPDQWIALLIMVIIGIPFQSAGEEYAFRGIVLQSVGSWFANPKVAWVVSMIPSVLLFAAAHGSSDPWIFADLAVFAVASCILLWRTGGLEASVALHASNNITIMIATILFGGWDQAFVNANSQGSPLAPLVTLVVNAIAVTLILWQAKRRGIQRIYRPAALPPQRVRARRCRTGPRRRPGTRTPSSAHRWRPFDGLRDHGRVFRDRGSADRQLDLHVSFPGLVPRPGGQSWIVVGPGSVPSSCSHRSPCSPPAVRRSTRAPDRLPHPAALPAARTPCRCGPRAP